MTRSERRLVFLVTVLAGIFVAAVILVPTAPDFTTAGHVAAAGGIFAGWVIVVGFILG